MFESDVGGMFLPSLSKYLKARICSKCTGSQLVWAAAVCLQELWKEKLNRGMVVLVRNVNICLLCC